MVKYDKNIMTQNDKSINRDIEILSQRFFTDNDTIHIGVKSQFKEYLIATDKSILIYKRGFFTGKTFGESVFRLGYDSISAIEYTSQAFGAGYIEVIAHGVNNKNPDAWGVNKTTDPAQLENCFSAGRKGNRLLEPVYNKLYQLFQNYKQSGGASTTSEVSVNNFEQIRKYKELLELDIISQSEFDTKRRELLDL